MVSPKPPSILPSPIQTPVQSTFQPTLYNAMTSNQLPVAPKTTTNSHTPLSHPPPVTKTSPVTESKPREKNLKRKLSESSTTASKKMKLGKQKIKYKELNVLVSDPNLPVHLGYTIYLQNNFIDHKYFVAVVIYKER